MRYRVELITPTGKMTVARFDAKGYALPMLTGLAALYDSTYRLIVRDTRTTQILASQVGTQS